MATGWSGTRTATVAKPPVVTAGTVARASRTSVSGPGQKRSASRAANGVTLATTPSRSSADARCTISGLSAGRPLTANIRRTAAGSSAFAANP
jgi:hypothetical protein